MSISQIKYKKAHSGSDVATEFISEYLMTDYNVFSGGLDLDLSLLFNFAGAAWFESSSFQCPAGF